MIPDSKYQTMTPSHIIQYLYCKRFTYFEHVLKIPQFEEKHYKVLKGRETHEQKATQNIGYLRKRLGVIDKKINQYLTNDLLRGEVDEILTFKDGTMAALDYKFAEYKNRIYDTYKTQLYCYAWLIEDNFKVKVNKGFLVYTRSNNKLIEIPITEKHKNKVKSCANEINSIILGNRFPKGTTYKSRCAGCSYRNICIK